MRIKEGGAVQELDGKFVYLRDEHLSNEVGILGKLNYFENDNQCYGFRKVALNGDISERRMHYHDLISLVEVGDSVSLKTFRPRN